MIAQLSNIQQFFAAHMTDVLDWGKHVRPDPERKTSGDAAYAVIDSGLNRYKISCLSSYVDPPAGAPYQCKALGTVTFDDFAGSKHIVAPKCDTTWMEIARHIHVRELTDGLAIARRELAEASPETVGAVRVRVAELASRAQKWGIEVKGLPVAAMIDPHDPRLAPGAASQWTPEELAAMPKHHGVPITTVDDLRASSDEVVLSPGNDRKTVTREGLIPQLRTVGDRPFLGCPVLFITNPGESITGMAEIPGWCVNVHSDETISAFITPDHSEPMYRDKMQRRNLAKGIRSNCWDFNEQLMAPYRMAGEVEKLAARVAELEGKWTGGAKEAKPAPDVGEPVKRRPGPGRPSNAEKAAKAAAQASEPPKDDERAA